MPSAVREALIASTAHEPVALEDLREPLRVVIASLALGGAERIVVEWLAAEAATGRACELAVLNARRQARVPPHGVKLVMRGEESPQDFMRVLCRAWSGARAPLSTHLVGDQLLAILWAAGLRTVPVVHNVRQGWRNDPRLWRPEHVPLAVACAGAVAAELAAAGGSVPLTTLRHRPAVGTAAFDAAARARVRAELGIAADTLMVLALGAIKPQKDYPRAIEVLRHLLPCRDCVLVIAGGVLERRGLAELDRVMDRALAAGVVDRLRLPGFVDPVEPLLAAADALLNVSRFEGLSMAVREALAAGLPVVATDVGGQRESRDPLLQLVRCDALADGIAERLAAMPVREQLARNPRPRLPRAWSLTLAHRSRRGEGFETLFVTANLNAGGAQRSLVNLATELAGRHRLAVAVVGASTQAAFADALARAGVDAFRPAPTADPCAAAESLLAWAAIHGVRSLCFWNVDARVKLLLARFAPRALRLIDVSPGHHAFEELEAAAPWGEAIDTAPAGFYARIDVLVLKYRAAEAPPGVRSVVIPNGVVVLPARAGAPPYPRFLVSGRIAPTKRLEVIVAAFALVQARHPGAELHVVGQAEPRHADYAESIQAQARELKVVFRGAMPNLEFLAEPFTAALVLGVHQGSPNAVLEAMSAGIAVIANASGGTGEIVADRRSGWLLDVDCGAHALAQAMLESIADPLVTERLALGGQAFVAAHHGIDVMAERYLALFEECRDAIAAHAGDARPGATIDRCMSSSSAPAS